MAPEHVAAAQNQVFARPKPYKTLQKGRQGAVEGDAHVRNGPTRLRRDVVAFFQQSSLSKASRRPAWPILSLDYVSYMVY